MKIAIIGNPGSGKSTLAEKLHEQLKIPVYHLDQYFWKPGWQRPALEEFEKIHQQLCDQGQWIIEGMAVRFFAYRAEKADVIIFLDLPLRTCIYRIFKRAVCGFGKVRKSSAPGCPERLPDKAFLRYVLNFNREHRPGIWELLEKHAQQKKIFVVKNKRQIEEIIRIIQQFF